MPAVSDPPIQGVGTHEFDIVGLVRQHDRTLTLALAVQLGVLQAIIHGLDAAWRLIRRGGGCDILGGHGANEVGLIYCPSADSTQSARVTSHPGLEVGPRGVHIPPLHLFSMARALAE